MSDFLFDTLVWTGVLLALVLVIRRPVAQLFGARAAYALWALPMARLLLPPLVLPRWLAPLPTGPSLETAILEVATEAPLVPVDSVLYTPSMRASSPAIDWDGLLLALWLAGAAVFLVRRYALYFRMRRELLARARPMGEAGRIRLVETPAADGPVAFGVIDKVVALPVGFMAGQDRTERDLALAHELAHHRGHDLVCNLLVQPLFALHWFNPLSVIGWRALRRDQEAACDARVMARETRERRAAYAAVIARFAIQPRQAAKLALAAPMACPVLGDRSIVQRLKSLTMNDISARRRWTGRLMIAAAALALPLTGSITYARGDETAAPAPPPPPPVAKAPEAPAAPREPEAPRISVSDDGRTRIVEIERPTLPAGDDERRVARRVIIQTGERMTARDREEFARDMAEQARDREERARERGELERDRAEHARDMAEHARDMAEFQREMARERVNIDREVRVALAEAHAEASAAVRAAARAPRVVAGCRPGQNSVAETIVDRDGKQQVFVCSALATAQARRALATARAEINDSRDLTEEQRIRALRSIDQAERAQDAR